MAKKISTLKYRKRKIESYHLVGKLYRFLLYNPENILFKKLRGSAMGYYDCGSEEITIDYRKEIIPTIIHEFIHHLHPSWLETKVTIKEKQIISVLSPRQCGKIFKLLANCF